MADATDSKSVARKGVWVQVPPPVLSVLWLAIKTDVGQRQAEAFPTSDVTGLSPSHIGLRAAMSVPCRLG